MRYIGESEQQEGADAHLRQHWLPGWRPPLERRAAPMAMPPSTQEFWKLAQQAKLLTASEAARLQIEFARYRPAADGDESAPGTAALANWLVANGQITRYQAKTLLAGRAGPFLLGNYVLREAIREGRLAGLARARHVPTGYDVLLAFCDESTASNLTRLAHWESAARAACKTVSPQLSRTYEVVTLGKRRFAVVEDLAGATVAERLARGERFSPAEACRIVYDVAITALTFDGAGRVHGEIRADNIWLDEAGQVKLLQFPLASASSKKRADGGSAQVDVRALGTLLYWMLFGCSPSTDAREGRNPLARAAADLPAPYARLIEYLLTSDPAKRYQSLAMAADGLAALAAPPPSQPSSVEPPDPARLAYESSLETPPDRTAEIPVPESDSALLAETVAWPIEQMAPEPPTTVVPPRARKPAERAAAESDFASLVHTPIQRRKKQGSPLLLLVVLLVVAGASGFGVYAWLTWVGDASTLSTQIPVTTKHSTSPTTAASLPAKPTPPPITVDASPPAPVTSAPQAPEDLSVWQSPTTGEALDLAWIAPTSQMFVVWRPAEFLSHAEGERVLASLGVLGQQTRHAIEKLVGLPWPQVEQVSIGFLADGNGGLRYSLAARTVEPVAQTSWLAGRGASPARIIGGQAVSEVDGYGYYLPTEDEKLFVVAPLEELGALLADGGAPPVLRREFAELLARSDRSRHFTLLVAPSFLATDGSALLADGAQRLRAPLLDLFSNDTAAVLASAHLTAADLFLELRIAGTADTTPEALSSGWQARMTALPRQVGDYVAALAPSEYSAKVLQRFPAMVAALTRFTRGGIEDHNAVLRTYLPVVAAHNLTLGAQLALAEDLSPAAAPTDMPLAAAPQQSVRELLAQQTSLSFPRNTLEQALLLLGEGIGTEIVILGSDLQLEGITKNQSFGLDERDQPAREILLKILRLANPDGKLVYVVREAEDGSGDALYVTTRAAAAKRGEILPAEFAAEPAKAP